MLIDEYLPDSDAAIIVTQPVACPPFETWDAMLRTDLRDPVINALFTLRELPDRVARRWRGQPTRHISGPVTFGSLRQAGPGFCPLAERRGEELVVGSVGKFWRRDYGGRVTPEEFVRFNEPGYARLAISVAILPQDDGGTLLRYEARTATTDPGTRKTFLRYWRLIHPGVAIVMKRALARIRREAERGLRTGIAAFAEKSW